MKISKEAITDVPEGWRLVPVKPTMEMVKNAAGDHEGESWLPHSLWASMLAAAPVHPSSPGIAGDGKVLVDVLRQGIKDQGYGYTMKGNRLTVSTDEVFAVDLDKLASFILSALISSPVRRKNDL